MIHTNDKYWRTNDFYLATYLFAKGAVITGVHVDDDRTAFAFLSSPEMDTWYDEFRFGKPLIDARFLIWSISILQKKKYEAFMRCHGKD
jgi:hypothetical protein